MNDQISYSTSNRRRTLLNLNLSFLNIYIPDVHRITPRNSTKRQPISFRFVFLYFCQVQPAGVFLTFLFLFQLHLECNAYTIHVQLVYVTIRPQASEMKTSGSVSNNASNQSREREKMPGSIQ